MHVRSALEEVPGVISVEVDLLKKSAMVEGEALNDGILNAAVVASGYRITAVSGNR